MGHPCWIVSRYRGRAKPLLRRCRITSLRVGRMEVQFAGRPANRRVELIEVRHDRLTRLAGVLVAYERVACDAVQQVVQTTYIT